MKSLEQLTKYKIKDSSLFEQVFTHRSYPNSSINNEKLEFLGDAILNFLVSDLLFKIHPHLNEGDLSKKRSQWVSGLSLAEIAKGLNFSQYLKTSNPSFKNNPRILAGALEAYLGAVYLEGGIVPAKKLVRHLFENKIKQDNIEYKNYKSLLQEYYQKKHKSLPVYKIQKEEGREHDKIFYIEVFFKDKLLGSGSGSTKKQAEQEAAKQALQKMSIKPESL